MKKDAASNGLDEASPETQSLSLGAAELLDAWLQSQEVAPEPDAPDVAVLVAYLSGALNADALRIVERSISLHPSARTLLRSTRETLRMLRTLPWSEAARQSQTEDLTGQVARAWLALAAGAVAEAPSAQEWWQGPGWHTIRQELATGATGVKAAWANFLSFGNQLRAAFQMVAPAVARSGSEAPALLRGALPPGIELTLSAEVGPEGALQSTLFVRDLLESPSLSLAGTQIQLLFLVNGQTWPLASTQVEDDRAIWILPGLGTALGLAGGPLPAAYFCIALQNASSLPSGSVMPLLAEVLDAGGKPTNRLPIRLELQSEPQWVDGKFHLEIALSEPMRIAYEAYQLRLDVVVFGNFRQCLGCWPIGDWSDAPRRLTADCPGCHDASVPYASILHAIFQPLPIS